MTVLTIEYMCQTPGMCNYFSWERSWAADLKWYHKISGRTNVDFADASLDGLMHQTVTVAHYTGAEAPDVSNWRVKSFASPNVAGTFAAADGNITATFDVKGGFIIIFR